MLTIVGAGEAHQHAGESRGRCAEVAHQGRSIRQRSDPVANVALRSRRHSSVGATLLNV
jgi:hypothetical protein